ncbi:hypothetical protein BurMR1_1869 [Burkholderia sp. MR1]|nr:hypothetical protein BurMR1_1869 [Burkholderia sp. MR1]
MSAEQKQGVGARFWIVVLVGLALALSLMVVGLQKKGLDGEAELPSLARQIEARPHYQWAFKTCAKLMKQHDTRIQTIPVVKNWYVDGSGAAFFAWNENRNPTSDGWPNHPLTTKDGHHLHASCTLSQGESIAAGEVDGNVIFEDVKVIRE